MEKTNVTNGAEESKALVVKFKKLNDEAVIPSYAKEGDAGLDLTAVSLEYDATLDAYVYHTGLAMEIPKGYVGLVYPRSSNRKTDAYMTNHVGVIDSGYRGEVLVTFKNRDKASLIIAPYVSGERVAQLIVMSYPTINPVEAEELSDTERGTDGHGSTGK